MAEAMYDALAKDVTRCAKKHKAAASAAADGVDRVLEALQQARAGGDAEQGDAAAAQLRARLAEVGEASAAAVSEAAKELTAVVGKLGKARATAKHARERATSCDARASAPRLALTLRAAGRTATPDGRQALYVRRCARLVGAALRRKHAAAGVRRARPHRCSARPPTRPPGCARQVIARHLYRDGRFDVAELYCSETGAVVPEELKARSPRTFAARRVER